MTTELKRILLADDSPRDTELALDALAQHNLANEVVTVRDGAEASTTCIGAARTPTGPLAIQLSCCWT